MHNTNIETYTATLEGATFRSWLANQVRRWAESIEGVGPEPVTVDDVRRETIAEVELALFKAELDEERHRHTVAMLRERLGRLKCERSHHSSGSFGRST